MSNITLRRARQNRPFKGNLELRMINGDGPFVLPQAAGTYELRLYRHNNPTPFATATIANTKLAISVTAEATVVTYNFPAGDMAALAGYGSMELISTVAGSVPVVVPPLFFEKEDTPYTVEDGEKLVIYNETIVAVVSLDVAGLVLSDVAVTVNVLAPGSAGSASFIGNTFTLNVPKGDTGSNGVMSAAEVLKGARALDLFAGRPQLLGRKAIVMDMIGGGAAIIEDGAAAFLGAIENVPGTTIIRSGANARRRTCKRKGESVAANTLRAHHSKEGSPIGTLYENSAVNLLYNTSNLIAWGIYGAVLGGALSSGFADPDGGTDAFKYTENTAVNATHMFWGSNFPITASKSYVASGFIKANGRTKLDLYLSEYLTNTWGVIITLDLTAKTATASNVGAGTNATVTIEEYPDGWFKFTLSGKLNGGATGAYLFFYINNNVPSSSYTGDGASGIFVYGLQVEEGTHASSWIPTPGNATATRSADGHSVALTGFTSDEMLLVAEFFVPPANSNYKYVLATGGASSADRIELYFSPGYLTLNVLVVTAGVIQFATAITGLTAGQKTRIAVLLSKVEKTAKWYRTGAANGSAGLYGGLTVYTPPVITKTDPANYYNNYQLDSSLCIVAVIDGGALPANIIGWVEDI